MSETNLSEYAALGANVALCELNIKPEGFLKAAGAVDALYSRKDRGSVMRKSAELIADFLDSFEETRGRKSSNLIRLISKSADWHESYDGFVRDAYVPLMEKRAAPGGMLAEVAMASPGLALTLTALIAGLGGAGWHYAEKQVDEDHIDIEKQEAVQNEYRRLADEIDRKITARSLRTQ